MPRNQNQNQGKDNNQRKPRNFTGSELMEVLADTGAFLSAQVVLGSIRRGLASVFTNGIASKIDVTKNADSDMISAAIKQVKDNIKVLDLPEDLKQDLDRSSAKLLLGTMSALHNDKMGEAERMLHITKLKDDMAAEMNKAVVVQHQRSFQVRVLETLPEDVRFSLAVTEDTFDNNQRQSWLVVRESIESTSTLMVALRMSEVELAAGGARAKALRDAAEVQAQAIALLVTGGALDQATAQMRTNEVRANAEADAMEQVRTARIAANKKFLSVLEAMIAKPKAVPETGFKTDLENAGKALFNHAAVASGLKPDPLPVMNIGESDVAYALRCMAAKPDIAPHALEERVRSEHERLERNDRLADHKQAHDDYWSTLVRRR